MKVSIIIPCHNYGHFLEETLQSVYNQIFEDWECLIIDDGSSDNTAEIANKHSKNDPRIIYIYQQQSGVSSARNTGIRQAKGEYIQFLDADDFIENKKLLCQLELFEKNQTLDIIFGSARYFTTEDPTLRLFSMTRSNQNFMPEISGKRLSIVRELLDHNMIPINCALIRKSVFETVGVYNTDLKYLEDWEFWFRCAVVNKNFYFQEMPQTYALVRSHPISASKDEWNMVVAEKKLRTYFDAYLSSDLMLYNQNQKKDTEVRLIHVVIIDLINFKFKKAYHRLKWITSENNIVKIFLYVYHKKLFPTLSFGRLLFYCRKLFFRK